MLSYRHAFHAGNHADVLKHFVLLQLLHHLSQKEKPFWVVDTHAGAGCYALTSGYATQLAEYTEGIGRLWSRSDCPPALRAYLNAVRQLNPDGALKHYPGSPWLTASVLRGQDRLHLAELHSNDHRLLRTAMQPFGRRVMLQPGDGYAALKALLPPPPRRALILIDPSYEDKHDYVRVIEALDGGLSRFATGIYAIWYPQLARSAAQQLPEKLKCCAKKDWLHVRLTVRAPTTDGLGMVGSGLFIKNPPWTLAHTLREELPYLAQILAQDASAGFVVEQSGD